MDNDYRIGNNNIESLTDSFEPQNTSAPSIAEHLDHVLHAIEGIISPSSLELSSDRCFTKSGGILSELQSRLANLAGKILISEPASQMKCMNAIDKIDDVSTQQFVWIALL